MSRFFIISLVCFLILLLFIVLYFNNDDTSESFSGKFNESFSPPITSDQLQFLVNNDDNHSSLNGNQWVSMIQDENLRGTDIQQTNSEFVKKIKNRPYLSTPFRSQEFDDIKSSDNQIGLRRHNLHKGSAPAFCNNPTQIFSEYNSDAQLRPFIQMHYPAGLYNFENITHPSRQQDDTQANINNDLLQSQINYDIDLNEISKQHAPK